MSEPKHRRIQFVVDALVQQIVDGVKAASVVGLTQSISPTGTTMILWSLATCMTSTTAP